MTTITTDESTRAARIDTDHYIFQGDRLEPAIRIRFGALEIRVALGADQQRMDLALAILSIGRRGGEGLYRAQHGARMKPMTLPVERLQQGPYVVIDGETMGAERTEEPL